MKQFFDYNPDTGELYWKVPRGQKMKAGQRAGSLDTKGYIQVRLVPYTIRAHRIAWAIMTGKWPTLIDHINRNKADNRWINLREVTQAENWANNKNMPELV